MLRFFMIVIFSYLSLAQVCAQEHQAMQQFGVHVEDNIVYCDVQTFQQESYILKVLAGGSAMTVTWQFEVDQYRSLWLNKAVASVRLGRQVIPDLVTQRWLMRDLSSGVVGYTSDVHAAMRFLTEMNQVAVVDASVLEYQTDYVLHTTFYMYEGERRGDGWWSSLVNWGVGAGSVSFQLPNQDDAVER